MLTQAPTKEPGSHINIKGDFKPRNVIRHFLGIKGSSHPKDTAVANAYAAKIRPNV